QNFFQYGLNKVDPNKVKITLIEAADRILTALSPKVAANTMKQLEQFGIEVLTSHRVTKVDEDKIYFADGSSLDAEIKVGAAGIKAAEVLAQLDDMEKDHIHRLKVYAALQSKSDPSIFAFGDCVHCRPAADQPVLGPRAQVA